MYFHACRKCEIESRNAQLRTPLASHKDIREKIVIAYRISGYTYRQKYARRNKRGIKHRRSRTVLIKNVRAVLKNTKERSYFLILQKCSQNFTYLPPECWITDFNSDSTFVGMK